MIDPRIGCSGPVRLRLLTPTLVFVLGVLAAACGGGTGSTTAPTTTAGGTATSTTPTSAAPPTTDPAKAAKATAAVFQQGDFPAGWAPHVGLPHPHPPGEGEGLDLELIWQDVTRCLGVDTVAPSRVTATSPTYLRDLATQGQSTVEYTTAASADAVATALAGPKAQQCVKDAFSADVIRNAPAGATPGAVVVAPMDPAQAGQKTIALRVNAIVKLTDLEVPLFQDFLAIFNGETVIRFLFLNPGGPFPPELERTLVQKVVGRA